MKKIILLSSLFILASMGFAQTPGYYNGTENLTGDQLKDSLHKIIKGHIDFSYSDAKYILNYADEDPDNTSNLIQLYSGRSVSKSAWGTGSDETNREHVWAKSHGNFADVRPMDGDAHNLHPGDASVNVTRSNYDFDEVTNGTYIEEADAYYNSTDQAFEPADRDKGVIARTIFYMDVRYEGTDGELDLEVADETGTYPNAKHGKLSTLLQWNRDFPPTAFEKRRNDRVYLSQRNRNPFIDNPDFADLIWAGAQVSGTTVSNLSMSPEYPETNDLVTITATFTNSELTPTATLYYGTTFDSETYSSAYTGTGTMTASLDLSNFSDYDLIYLKTVTSDGVIKYNSFYVAPNKTITPISSVQGTGDESPLTSQVVTISGIVTANLDNSFYMQSGTGLYSGICVYSTFRGYIGDSVTATGTATEYYTLTELGSVTMVYSYGLKDTLEPVNVAISDLSEAYEGMFIQLDNVVFSAPEETITTDGGTYTLTQGTDELTVYIRYNSRLSGSYFPGGTLSVKGILSEYSGTYQLLIDNDSWINYMAEVEAPVAVNDTVYTAINTTVKILPLANDEYTPTISMEIYKDASNGTTQIPFTNTSSINYTPNTDFTGTDTIQYKITYTSDESLYSIGTIIIYVGSTSIAEQKELSVSLYPNPSEGNITLNLDDNGFYMGTINVFDLSGRNVYSETVSFIGDQKNIDLSNLNKGPYLIQVDLNGNSLVKKLMIE